MATAATVEVVRQARAQGFTALAIYRNLLALIGRKDAVRVMREAGVAEKPLMRAVRHMRYVVERDAAYVAKHPVSL